MTLIRLNLLVQSQSCKPRWFSKLPVVGGIAIPEVGINLPIFKGLGNTELTYGAGTSEGKSSHGWGK